MSFTSARLAPSPFDVIGRPRWSDVYISALGRAISSFGDILASIALVLMLQSRGAKGLAVAAILLATAVPPVLLASVAGRIADRLDSRYVVVTAGLVQSAICVLLAYAGSPMLIVGLVALLSAGLAVTQPTLSALTPEMVGRDNLAKAGGIGQAASSIGLLIAPVAGALLVGAYGARIPLLIDAVTYLSLPVIGFVLRTRRRGGRPVGPLTETAARSASPVSGPAWSIWSDAILRPMTILFAAVILAASAINVAEVFFIRGTLHASYPVYGVLSALWFVGILGGSALVARRKPDDARMARLMFAMVTGTSLAVALIALAPQPLWLVPVMLFGGLTNGGENVVAGTLIGRRSSSATRGHAFAVFGGVANAANAIGYVIGGVLLALVTPRLVIFVTGVAGLALVAVFARPLLRAASAEAAALDLGSDLVPGRPEGTKIMGRP